MAVRTVDTDTEQAKRKLVKDIAASGRAAVKTKEQTVKGNQDLSAAGVAAVKGDPVDLNAAATNTASAINEAPSKYANRYADATKAIFDAQRATHEGTMGTRLGSAHDVMLEANNFALAEYDKSLAEQAAARAAARSRGGGGGYGPSSTSPFPDEASFSENFTDEDLRRSDVAWQNIGDEAAMAAENAARASLAAGNDWPTTRNTIYHDMIRQGYLGPEINDYLRFLEEILVGNVDVYVEPESDASSIMRARQAANAANSPPAPTGNPGSFKGNPDV